MNRLWSSSTTVLMQIPDIMTPEDVKILQSFKQPPLEQARCYEAMIRRYGNHPFFVAGVAAQLSFFGATRVAERMLREVRESLKLLGIEENQLNEAIERCANTAAKRATENYDKSLNLNYSQIWRPSREHKFPLDLPLPEGHEQVKEVWAKLLSQDEDYRRKYLVRHAIDTNAVGDIFLLEPSSADDIVHRGVDKGRLTRSELVCTLLGSHEWIRHVIRETASGYDIVSELANEPQKLSRQKICDAHAKIMETCRVFYFTDDAYYIPPGETRTTTQETVTFWGRNTVAQRCPYMSVDEEVDFICDETKEYMRTRPQNPFATASWLHLLLAQCDPFDDGNDRVIRMIASVPLIMAGYPMINIDLDQSVEYEEGIGRAYEGDHAPLVKCFVDGMRKTLERIQGL